MIALVKVWPVLSFLACFRWSCASSILALFNAVSIFTNSLAMLISLSIFLNVSFAFSVVSVSRPFKPELKSWESFINDIYFECSSLKFLFSEVR